MERRPYSAGAVKHAFWFMEFRKVVSLREEGKSWDEIRLLNENENIFGAPTKLRANQIWSTVSARIKCLDDSFYPVFQSCDVAGQKLFALTAAMAYDTLFGEFVYEVIWEKMIIGLNEFADSDIRIFFNNKQAQDEKAAKWTDATLKRLGACYKTLLFEAGMTDKRPIYWLFDSGKQNGFKALIYLHRYNADTIGNLRIDYLHRMQRIYESEINRMQDMIDHSTSAREAAQAAKRREKLTKQLKECREYDEKLAHLALSRIELDLDDGVKVNYRKLQTASDGKFYEVLADSKNIMVKK